MTGVALVLPLRLVVFTPSLSFSVPTGVVPPSRVPTGVLVSVALTCLGHCGREFYVWEWCTGPPAPGRGWDGVLPSPPAVD